MKKSEAKETRGRKKMKKEERRELINIRVAPEVAALLREVQASGDGMSLGLAVDKIVLAWKNK